MPLAEGISFPYMLPIYHVQIMSAFTSLTAHMCLNDYLSLSSLKAGMCGVIIVLRVRCQVRSVYGMRIPEPHVRVKLKRAEWH